jgi:hypothetical protein
MSQSHNSIKLNKLSSHTQKVNRSCAKFGLNYVILAVTTQACHCEAISPILDGDWFP